MKRLVPYSLSQQAFPAKQRGPLDGISLSRRAIRSFASQRVLITRYGCGVVSPLWI